MEGNNSQNLNRDKCSLFGMIRYLSNTPKSFLKDASAAIEWN